MTMLSNESLGEKMVRIQSDRSRRQSEGVDSSQI
jgi:hypothetical protein